MTNPHPEQVEQLARIIYAWTPRIRNYDHGYPRDIADANRHAREILASLANRPADDGEWLPITDDAKSGNLVELVVDYSDGDHPLQDGVLACTIGFNTLADTGEDEWKFAGWCWSHDHFVQGKGKPVAWRPSRLTATDDALRDKEIRL